MYELQTIPIFSIYAFLIQQNLGVLKQRDELISCVLFTPKFSTVTTVT